MLIDMSTSSTNDNPIQITIIGVYKLKCKAQQETTNEPPRMACYKRLQEPDLPKGLCFWEWNPKSRQSSC